MKFRHLIINISIKKIKEYFTDASNTAFEFIEVSQDRVVTIAGFAGFAGKKSHFLVCWKNYDILKLLYFFMISEQCDI